MGKKATKPPSLAVKENPEIDTKTINFSLTKLNCLYLVSLVSKLLTICNTIKSANLGLMYMYEK